MFNPMIISKTKICLTILSTPWKPTRNAYAVGWQSSPTVDMDVCKNGGGVPRESPGQP
jgi:hypothetical protein